MFVFQSTPTLFRAGDPSVRAALGIPPYVSIHAHPFQGRRPDGTRDIPPVPSVSIHAHPFQGRRPASFSSSGSASLFQSTPTLFRAGDARTHCSSGDIRSFDPRPPFSGQATGVYEDDETLIIVSIHAHPFQGRRHQPDARHRGAQLFQSTPTLFRAGDSRRRASALRPAEFQSTPTLFRAGDKAPMRLA